MPFGTVIAPSQERRPREPDEKSPSDNQSDATISLDTSVDR
jgi:hypothetical protein